MHISQRNSTHHQGIHKGKSFANRLKTRLWHGKDEIILFYPLNLPPPDSRRRRQCLGPGCANSTEASAQNSTLQTGETQTRRTCRQVLMPVNTWKENFATFTSGTSEERLIHYTKVYKFFCFISVLFPDNSELPWVTLKPGHTPPCFSVR